MDLHDTKARVAAALVESIFRRARFAVRPFRDDARLRFSREDLVPSFWVAVPGDERADEFLIDVRYRPFVRPFIALEEQRRGSSIFLQARTRWPAIRFVIVTDHPEPGRSCFQAVTVRTGEPLSTVDLFAVHEFNIFPHNVRDHEELLLRILTMLSADRAVDSTAAR